MKRINVKDLIQQIDKEFLLHKRKAAKKRLEEEARKYHYESSYDDSVLDDENKESESV